jgi:hypothetical protein
VEFLEISGRDHLLQERIEDRRVEHAVPAQRGFHELRPAQLPHDLDHLVGGHARRVGGADDGAGAGAADHVRVDAGSFEGAQHPDVGQTADTAASQSETKTHV